jgi:hypothetical protein
VAVEHTRGSAANFVNIFDLPGCVMQERHGGRLDQQVVMIGRAPDEGGDAPDLVAHLESDAIYEETLRGFGIGSADDDVTQFAGSNRFFAQDSWCTMVLSFGPAGPVVRPERGRIL